MRRVVVTGIGVVSPLGCSIDNLWSALLRGETAVQPLTGKEFSAFPKSSGAQVKSNELDLDNHCSPSDRRTLARNTLFALVASSQALAAANWPPDDDTARERTAVVVGAGMGDLAGITDGAETLLKGGKIGPHFVPRILASAAAGTVSLRHGFRGPLLAPATACAAGLHAIGDGYRLIQRGDADAAICGAAEASITPLSVAGFSRLRALTTSGISRPFDRRRDGFVMGEGAALAFLEEEGHARKRGARILAELLGLGLSGDAAHPTAPPADGHGAALAMSRALKDAGLATEVIGFIAAHAAGTPLGDAAELTAIRTVFGLQAPSIAITSSKGAHGHLLGAAGALETIIAVLSVSNGLIPPTCGLEEPCSEADGLNIVSKKPQSWPSERRIAIKNSFGFGGMNASLIISTYHS